MTNKWTFTIKPIKELLEKEVNDSTNWIDPFCGENGALYADYINDLAKDGIDALEFLKGFADNFADGILLDPPYSITQAAECYKSFGKEKLEINVANMAYWKAIKDNMARIIKPGGKAICFGWNSMGLGKNRGFEMKRILLVPHGGSKNDTIVTVETKL
jgi:hypothetical protein